MDPNYSGEASLSGYNTPMSPTTELAIRKRKRSETSLSESQAIGALVPVADDAMDSEASSSRFSIRSGLKRDPTYYFEDGSCVLLVQDTLFNGSPCPV
ncbi:hypothetical protein E1B28_012170 [Marasmius oreades]|uniref:Uncharacterized protein n=1 Tax=Marasmius oreades TaxID=181124 RepID=A0A9P7RRM8_9AGAR|nr:uncharacterized protein E1B28_012170 [Marasmius oreades]KAG7088148.1 hypothetical protein E1B28_012170 [Marasmius oreades]